MPQFSALGHIVGTSIKAGRLLVRGSVRGGAWATRRVGTARARGAANEVGMIRLFDLHAVSCAGDALIAIGLAGTIFSVPLGEARSKVALYLLITMVPFALLAPVVGPLLDHFRHGRRYALATTFLGRAFLAYVMSDNLLGWGLYPAAFGVLALSRAYGVARSAAVPRLLPDGVGLSQVGARASVYGTFAGILVAPIGLLAFKFGPQWPLRVATVIFMIGVVVALRLPPRADSDPPEAMPWAWRTVLGMSRGTDRPLSGRLVVATLIGSSSLRLLYGFLLLFLTFAIMGGQLTTTVLGVDLGRNTAVGLVGGALVLGTFLSTAAGTGLRIRRPLALQSSGLVVTAGVAVLTTIFYNLAMVTVLALLTAVFSGIAKLAVDASIQERVPEQQRATAFAHSETALMLAWVTGGGLGLIPFDGRLGIGLTALLAVLAAGRAGWAAARLHNERLAGRPGATSPDASPGAAAPAGASDASPGAAAPNASAGAASAGADLTDDAFSGGGHDRTSAGTPQAGPRTGGRRGPSAASVSGEPAAGRPGATRSPAAGPAATRSPAAGPGATQSPAARPDGIPAPAQRVPGGSAPDGAPQPPGAEPGAEPGARRWWQRKRRSTTPAAADQSENSRGRTGDPGRVRGRSGRSPDTSAPASDAPTSERAGDSPARPDRASGNGPATARPGGRGRGDTGQDGRHHFPDGDGRHFPGGDDGFPAPDGRGNFPGPDGGGDPVAPPGYHVYRPSSAGSPSRDDDPRNGGDS